MPVYITGKIESQEDLDSLLYDVQKEIKRYTESLVGSYDVGVETGYNQAKSEIEYDDDYDL